MCARERERERERERKRGVGRERKREEEKERERKRERKREREERERGREKESNFYSENAPRTPTGTHLVPSRPARLVSCELQLSSRFFTNTRSSHKVVTRAGRAAAPSSLWPRAALVASSGNQTQSA